MTTSKQVYTNENEITSALPFLVPSATLIRKKLRVDSPDEFMLEAVRDEVASLVRRQNPEDVIRTLSQLHVDFMGGNMSAKLLNPNGLGNEMLVLDSAATQLASYVLPRRFMSGLKQLAHLDSGGEKIATMAWRKFALAAKGSSEEARRLRVITKTVGGQERRVIRSANSATYAPYSHLEFLNALLACKDHFAAMPVLNLHITDKAMRIRFLLVDHPKTALAKWREGVEIGKAVPMVECWNSETGHRSVMIRGGKFRFACFNGMGHWDEKRDYKWIHSGATARIRGEVPHAVEDVIVAAKGVVEAYDEAMNVSIDDAFAFMEAELTREGETKEFKQQAVKALRDDSTTPGGVLASVIDAITLAAQDEDPLRQYDRERIASKVLARGQAMALKNNNVITVG